MLQWNHNWGTKIKFMDGNIARGMKVPEDYNARPETLPVSRFYLAALYDLDSERAMGMAEGPIPRSKALAYASEHDIDDPDELDAFWSLIARLDNEQTKIRHPAKPDLPEPEPQGGRKRLPAPRRPPRAKVTK